jgi:DNA-binding transcriptional ArsR family regulator
VSQTRAEILLHPNRLRIVLAFGAEHLTTAEVADRLPDIAQATLYRQVATLADAGLLEVVNERRIRGGVERTYALASDAARLGPEDASAMSNDELLRGFVVFAGTLIDALGRYLDDPAAKPGEDPVGYRQAAIWLDDAERAELFERLRSAVGPYLENEPTEDRERLLLNTILIPDRSTTRTDGG